METGRLEDAKAGYDQLLQMPQTAQNGDIYWLILYDRGLIAEAEKKPEQAIDYYRQALEVIEEQRSTIHTEANKIGFVGDKQQVYLRMVSNLIHLGRDREAFEYAERAKSRALVDMLAGRQQFAVPEDTLEDTNRILEKLDRMEAENRVQDPGFSETRHNRQRGLAVRLKKTLTETAPELASLVTVTPVQAKEIQSLIEEDETLVEYYYKNDQLFAFIVTRRDVKALRLKVANLVNDIRALRDHIADPSSTSYEGVANRLYQDIWHPIAGRVTGERLIVVPHGALHYLPFCALYSGRDYLIDRFKIRILPSAGVMPFLHTRERGGREDNMLAYGNPDLGDPKLDLAFAQDEAVRISKLWPRAEVLLRDQATESSLKSAGGRFKQIHFATHGKFDIDEPLTASGLMLVRDHENDGFLSVGELYTLRLNADLVTLSACETALSEVTDGDEVIGFTRGFLYAGANSIVSTLWSVDDRATRDLMIEFYRRMRETSKMEALKEAQLMTKERYGHPFYWAAFQLIGNAN
ncbi:MAG: CHAT domain-containing protein, partial [Deltaproteobacteria bacterium]|nr:CHAT domain-containing protein [Deltaproteobacteria bacterium]